MVSMKGVGRWLNRVLIFVALATIFALLAFGAKVAGISFITHVGVFLAVLALVSVVVGFMPISFLEWRNLFLFLGLAYLAVFLGPVLTYHFRLIPTIAASLLAILMTSFDAWMDDNFVDWARWYGILAFFLVLLNFA